MLTWKHRFLNLLVILSFMSSCVNRQENEADLAAPGAGTISVGWASADITPEEPVLLLGQWHARISEGVMDPLTVTALAIESGSSHSSGKVIMISCDLCDIADDLTSENTFCEKVRKHLKVSLPELGSEQIIINATHTHTAPVSSTAATEDIVGIDLEVMPPAEYMDFVTSRIAATAERAWKNRRPGGVSYGMGQAVVGRNRLISYRSGISKLYLKM